MVGVKEMMLLMLVGVFAVMSYVSAEARYPPSGQDQSQLSFHYLPGMCTVGSNCDACPSNRKTTVYKKKWIGWLKYKTVKQTVCCPNCGETLKYQQYKEDYSCMCPPVETCWRGEDCDGCDPRFVTKIYGRKFCCKNCMAASINLKYNMGMMDTCDCNIPVDAGNGPSPTTQVPDGSGSGEE
eukprot:GHVU01169040.1.p1 GENE.GHVU01169040.1~~GHVU01169040.1.p1  ORF type:complete len:182 (-),score=19.27 GHVU01169040.1:1089-1634(-)